MACTVIQIPTALNLSLQFGDVALRFQNTSPYDFTTWSDEAKAEWGEEIVFSLFQKLDASGIKSIPLLQDISDSLMEEIRYMAVHMDSFAEGPYDDVYSQWNHHRRNFIKAAALMVEKLSKKSHPQQALILKNHLINQ